MILYRLSGVSDEEAIATSESRRRAARYQDQHTYRPSSLEGTGLLERDGGVDRHRHEAKLKAPVWSHS